MISMSCLRCFSLVLTGLRPVPGGLGDEVNQVFYRTQTSVSMLAQTKIHPLLPSKKHKQTNHKNKTYNTNTKQPIQFQNLTFQGDIQ